MQPVRHNPLKRLALTLTPSGVHVPKRFYFERYAVQHQPQVRDAFNRELEKIEKAKVAIVGVPSDSGAGYQRGAAFGPYAIRTGFLSRPNLYEHLQEHGVIDLGDVHIGSIGRMDDGMIAPDVLEVLRLERWGKIGVDHSLPLTTITMLRDTLRSIYDINRDIRIMLLGGDHSFSSIPIEVLHDIFPQEQNEFGIFHIDAHTDYESKHGKALYVHDNWVQRAHALLGNDRIFQMGMRHEDDWEYSLAGQALERGLHQFWIRDCVAQSPEELANGIIEQLLNSDISKLYISNDLDGTDPTYAAATGTPLPFGLKPQYILEVLKHLGELCEIVGSDFMELAPNLGTHIPGEPKRTVGLAAHYVMEQIRMMLPKDSRNALKNPFEIPEPASSDEVFRSPELTPNNEDDESFRILDKKPDSRQLALFKGRRG